MNDPGNEARDRGVRQALRLIGQSALGARSELSLAGLGLTALPPALATLTALLRLDLSGNSLTDLPDWIGDLAELEELVLRGNLLIRLPPALLRLERLARLDAAGNRLVEIPAGLARLPRLSMLDLSGNRHLILPPPQIVAQGSHAVLEYLRGDDRPPAIPPEPTDALAALEATTRPKRAMVAGGALIVVVAAGMLAATLGGTSTADPHSGTLASPSGSPGILGAFVTPSASGGASTPGPGVTPDTVSATPSAKASQSATTGPGTATSPAAGENTPVYPTAAPGVDLAQGRPISASSVMEGYVAANAVDGNVASYWESDDSASLPQSLTVDLGEVTTVGRFVFNLPQNSAWNSRTETFTILGSTDGSSYFTVRGSAVYSFDANSASDDSASVTVSAVHARYIELSFTATDGWPAAQLSELNIYS